MNREEKISLLLNDQSTVSVFCDCSVWNTGEIGIGVCMVGSRKTEIFTCRIPGNNKFSSVYGEFKAVVFSVNSLHEAIEKFESASNIIIYSDYTRINQFIKRGTKHEYLLEVAEEYHCAISQFKELHPICKIRTTYLDFKRGNPFYKAAHNEARKVMKRVYDR